MFLIGIAKKPATHLIVEHRFVRFSVFAHNLPDHGGAFKLVCHLYVLIKREFGVMG